MRKRPPGPPDGATVIVAHPSPELYGSDRTLLESVSALVEGGWRPVVVLPHPGPLVDHVLALGAEVRYVDSLVLRKSLLTPLGLLRLVGSLRRILTLWRFLGHERPVLVYVNTVTVPLWLVAARLRRVPSVCHVHEAEEGLGRLLAWGLAAPLLLANRLIANSRVTTQVLTSGIGRLSARTRVIYNGVPGPAHPDALPVERPARVRLVLVGRIAPRKGTDIAIAALQHLHEGGYDVSLEIVGSHFPGYEWYEAEVRAAAGKLPDDRITFTGFMDDVWEVFAQSHIVLVPSRSEPFGNVAVEGMLARRPVVAAAVQGLCEIITDDQHGVLVPSENATELARAVGELCDDWSRTRGMAEAGCARARAAFSTGRYRQEISDLARSIARPPRRR